MLLSIPGPYMVFFTTIIIVHESLNREHWRDIYLRFTENMDSFRTRPDHGREPGRHDSGFEELQVVLEAG
jgi:hypothetical protein